MNEKVENLVLEHLRDLRAHLSRVEHKVDQLSGQMLAANQHAAGFFTSQMNLEAEQADHRARLERMERRMELREE